jgi:hypothetical protein
MDRFFSFFGGKKFFMVLVSWIAGVVVLFVHRVPFLEWIGGVTALLGFYFHYNVKQKDDQARKEIAAMKCEGRNGNNNH